MLYVVVSLAVRSLLLIHKNDEKKTFYFTIFPHFHSFILIFYFFFIFPLFFFSHLSKNLLFMIICRFSCTLLCNIAELYVFTAHQKK